MNARCVEERQEMFEKSDNVSDRNGKVAQLKLVDFFRLP